MIEAPTRAADHHDPARPLRDGRVERQLQVGRILVGRVPLDPDARALERLQAVGTDRVEVADRQVDPLPERERVVGAAVGRDHERRG